MKCTKHKSCEAYWDADGRLQHTARTGKKAKVESDLQERREAALGTSDAGAATEAPGAAPRARGGRRRGAAKTTQARTRTTTPATLTTDAGAGSA